jgi:outer membrane protein OmpA-like peptidoglycan-associated protein
MYVVGLGEQHPVADNSTSEGRRLNRRAELDYLVPVAAPPEVGFDIRFGFDKTDVNPALAGNFEQVAEYLNNYNEIILGIEGNTDVTGPQSYNRELSMRRALSVGNYLSASFNIPYSRIQFAGFGESSPTADNATLTGRRASRRVDLRCFKAAE